MKPASWFHLVSRVALGAVFVVSGFQKLASPAQNFAAVIEKFQIVPLPAAYTIAQTLPWVEFVVGTLFILGLWTRVSLFVLWALNTGFIGLLATAMWRKLSIGECGCFGKAASIPLPAMLALDVVFWWLFFVFFRMHGRVKAPSLDDRL